MLYICTKFCQSISKCFMDTDLDRRVDPRVVANVDGWMGGCMNGWKTGSLYRPMPEAGATKLVAYGGNVFIFHYILDPVDYV